MRYAVYWPKQGRVFIVTDTWRRQAVPFFEVDDIAKARRVAQETFCACLVVDTTEERHG